MSGAVIAAAAMALAVTACGTIPENDPLHPSPSASAPASVKAAVKPTVAASASAASGPELCEYEPSGKAAKSVRPPSPTGVATSGTVRYDLKMTEGTVRIALDPVRAPCTVHSFESLADQGFYDGSKCNRLMDSGLFLLQCGDPSGTGRGGPGYLYADELDGTESYVKGVVAMANTGPNANGSQFMMIYRDSTGMDKDAKYTIFGQVENSGIGVLERMAAEGQDGKNPLGGGKPNNPSQIISVTKVG